MGAALDRRGFLTGALGLGGAALLGTACGGGGGDGGGPVTIGMLPITDVAPVFLARERGVFEDHGLEIEPEFASGGAVILPSVQAGEFEVGFSNIVSLLLATSQGGRYTLVAGGGLTATGDDPDYSQTLVLNDSPLESLVDLSGQRVAINTLNNALQIVVSAAVDQAGGDWRSIDFREIPFPDMRAALESDEVDAIQYNEPFQTILQRTGTVRTLGQPFVDVAAGEVLAFYFVRTNDAESDTATGFRDAMEQANVYAAEHEDEVRAVIPEYLEVEPEIAAEVLLPTFVPDAIKRSSLEVYARLMTDYGLLDEEPDIEALLP